MGISLFGLTPAATYPSLIKFGDNSAISGVLRALSDGLGNDLPMQVSTASVNFTGTLTVGGAGLSPVSGVSGAIQFSNGSAFASDSTNLFWDDTNNRLGIGTNAPSATGHIVGAGTTSATSALLVQNNSGLTAFRVTNDAKSAFGGLGNNGYFGIHRESDGGEMGSISTSGNGINIRGGASFINCNNSYSNTIGASVLALGAMWGIRGSGSTSATTSLLVQNSAGTAALTVDDSRNTIVNGQFDVISGAANFRVTNSGSYVALGIAATQSIVYNASETYFLGNQFYFQSGTDFRFAGRGIFGGSIFNATAQLQVDSTTKGFLPPRMTNAQRGGIVTPAIGLMVYCTDAVEGLYVYKSTGWTFVI